MLVCAPMCLKWRMPEKCPFPASLCLAGDAGAFPSQASFMPSLLASWITIF